MSSLGEKCSCGLLPLQPSRELALRHPAWAAFPRPARQGQSCTAGPGTTPGTTVHLQKPPAAAAAPVHPCRASVSRWPEELATAHPSQPSPAALPALPHYNPGPAVTPRCGGLRSTLPRAGCRPLPACLPNPRARHGAACASWACRATRRRRRRRRVGATAPHACTMLLLLLLLLLPLQLALPEHCPRHSRAHHGDAQRGSVTSQPSLPTAATPPRFHPSPWNAPPPHLTSGGQGSRRGGRRRLPSWN